MTSASSIHKAGHSKLVLWDNPEGLGSGAEDGGTRVHPWLIHVNVWQKPPQYCKVIILQLLIKKKIELQGETDKSSYSHIF